MQYFKDSHKNSDNISITNTGKIRGGFNRSKILIKFGYNYLFFSEGDVLLHF